MQTVYIVTPVFNGADLIDRSIQHVLMQSGQFRIRYHVQDGGSTDGTLDKLAAWQDRLSRRDLPIYCDGIEFTYSSEPDGSMYEALTKGFAVLDHAPSDAFMTWINHDDLLLPGACALAAGLARQFDQKDVAWFTGTHNTSAHNGDPIPLWAFPLPQEFIAQGVADARLMGCVQQEGTFFRKWLWDAVDKVEAFNGLRRAGDWNLWRLMAQHSALHQVEWMQTGRFSHREGQLTDGFTEYLKEINGVVSRDDRVARFIELMNAQPLVTPSLYYNTGDKKYEKRDRTATRYQMLEQAAWQVPEIQPLFEEAIAAVNEHLSDATPDGSQVHVHQALDRLNRFDLMAPKSVKRLVDSALDVREIWYRELVKAPHKVSNWRALRRAQRRINRKKT